MAKLIVTRLVSLGLIAAILGATILVGCGEKIDPNDPSLKSNIKTKPGPAGAGGKKGAPGAGKAD